ncbi:MAG TPA: hypothetical protein VNH19_05030 [Candidatus Limnocylindrales bacterium]|nr:hypothetical protein [Candidatus Limnocylindrales bacterium]
MLEPDALLRVAEAYSEATGLGLTRISRRATGNNDKAFWRLRRGKGINANTALILERYFRDNWPENATWPSDVPGKPRKTIPPVINRRNKPPVTERNCETA